MRKMLILLVVLGWLALSSFTSPANTTFNTKASEFGRIKNSVDVYDSNNEPRYILYNYLSGGYAIYDKYNNEFLERSDVKNSSPFYSKVGKYYYYGLNNYGYKFGANIYDAYTDQTKNAAEQIKVPVFNTSTMVKAENEFINADYEIPHAEYFKHLDGVNNPFPQNYTGDCGYTAASILLGFIATYYNSDIMCEHYMNGVTTKQNGVLVNVASTTQEFKDDVLKLGIASDSTVPSDVHSAIENYFDSIDFHDYYHLYWQAGDISYGVMNYIRNGYPVLSFGNFNQNDIGEETGNHVVIGYGISQDNHVIAHLGWTNRSNVIVSSAYLGLIGGYYYIDVNEIEHKHGEFYINNGSYYCEEENMNITPSSKSRYFTYTKTQHKKICNVCGTLTYQSHMYMSSNNKRVCKYCGYVSNDQGPVIIG